MATGCARTNHKNDNEAVTCSFLYFYTEFCIAKRKLMWPPRKAPPRQSDWKHQNRYYLMPWLYSNCIAFDHFLSGEFPLQNCVLFELCLHLSAPVSNSKSASRVIDWNRFSVAWVHRRHEIQEFLRAQVAHTATRLRFLGNVCVFFLGGTCNQK